MSLTLSNGQRSTTNRTSWAGIAGIVGLLLLFLGVIVITSVATVQYDGDTIRTDDPAVKHFELYCSLRGEVRYVNIWSDLPLEDFRANHPPTASRQPSRVEVKLSEDIGPLQLPFTAPVGVYHCTSPGREESTKLLPRL